MTETVQAVETPVLDANASPEAEQADAVAKPEESEAESSPAVTDTDEIANKAKGVGKRIDELTRLRRDAERDRDYWRELAMREQRAAPKAPEPPKAEAPKTLADFEFDEGKYLSHIREQTQRDAVEAAKRELQAERERAESTRRLTEFRSRESKFAALTPDYAEVAHFAPVSDAVAGLVMDLDDGPAVAYYLGKNPEIARKLNELPESRVGIELGRIEARLQLERERAKEKPVSKAPPPTPKIEGVEPAIRATSTADPESDKLSDEEWFRLAEKERLKRRRD